MSKSTPTISLSSPLSWPSTAPTKKIQCAGQSFIQYKARSLKLLPFLPPHLQSKSAPDTVSTTSANSESAPQTGKNLLTSTRDPSSLTHYEILSVSCFATPSEIKEAYRKACLTYHPDKSQPIPEDSDSPFLLVKAAFDCLSDTEKKRAYDSSLPFDETIPRGNESESEFYETYSPVFERNKRFASKQKRFKNPPALGNDSTPLEKVHAFYEYWTHFESWRDFSLVASEELEHDVDMADCREEKRWMMKEIDRRAKALKKEEMSRINLLVERALNCDPRLRREKERERMEKEKREEEKRKKKEEKERKEKEEKERKEKEREEREKKEKEEKMKLKAEKEKEKKALRKARQSLRRLSMTGFQNDNSNTWESLDDYEDDITFLCQNLSAIKLTALSETLLQHNGTESHPHLPALATIKQTALDAKNDAASSIAQEKKQRQNAANKQKNKKSNASSNATNTNPWTKEEVSTLAKGIKKFPPGGANRWETIANFLNNSLQLENPRSKEECIAQYNSFANNTAMDRSSSGGGIENGKIKKSNGTNVGGGATASSSTSSSSNDWTEEQDKQLQDGLKKYPASMDKNERWTSIAKGVQGKGKKECVQRFKAIREALKSGKGK